MYIECHSDRAAPAAGAVGGRRAQRGVTLVEILITMGLAAVILGVAAPSFSDAVRANRARSAAQQLATLLNEARAEALKRNVPVLVCPSSDGVSCIASPTATSWAGRMIACYDADGNGVCDASTSTAPNPIRVRGAVDATVALSGPAVVLRFNGMGALAGGVSFSLSTGAAVAHTSTISIAATGAVRAY